MLSDICNVLIGTSKYGVSSHDTGTGGAAHGDSPYDLAMPTATLQPGAHTVSITARFAGGGVANHSIPIEIVAPRP